MRHRLAAVTFVGLLAPVYFIPPAFQAALPQHRFIGVLLSVASIVLLMTYVIMPALTRALSGWLQSDGPSLGNRAWGRAAYRCREGQIH